MSQAVINDDALHRWFWDLNFGDGANPPPSQWKLPPLKSAAEQKQTFAYFEGLVRYMKSFPQVRFISGSDAIRLFPDLAHTRKFSTRDLKDIATAVTPECRSKPTASTLCQPVKPLNS